MENSLYSAPPKFAGSSVYFLNSSASSSTVSSFLLHKDPLCFGACRQSFEHDVDSVPEQHSLGKDVLPPPGFGSLTSVALMPTTVAPPSTSVAAAPISIVLPQTSFAPPPLSVDPPLSSVAPLLSSVTPQPSVAPPQFTVAPPKSNVALSQSLVFPTQSSVALPESSFAPSLRLGFVEDLWSDLPTENKETGSLQLANQTSHSAIQAQMHLLQHLYFKDSLLQINSTNVWHKIKNTRPVLLLKPTSPLTMASQETGTASSLLTTANQEMGTGSSLLTTANQEMGTGSSLLTTNHKPAKSERYKTELCREFTEKGSCRYGERCQFAHGEHERRSVPRHAKYKTKRCRAYHSTGFCDYGKRCDFIHDENLLDMDERMTSSQRCGMGQNLDPTSGINLDQSVMLNLDPASGINLDPIFGMNLDLRQAIPWDQRLDMNSDHKLEVNSGLAQILDPRVENSLDPRMHRNLNPGFGLNLESRVGLNLNSGIYLNSQAEAGQNLGPKTWPFSNRTVPSSHSVKTLNIDTWVAVSSDQKTRQKNQFITLRKNFENPGFGHSSGFTDVDPPELSVNITRDHEVALKQSSSNFRRFEDWPAPGQPHLSSVIPPALPPLLLSKAGSNVSPVDEMQPLHVCSWDPAMDSTAVSLKQSLPESSSPSHMSKASTSNIWSSLFHYPRGWTLS